MSSIRTRWAALGAAVAVTLGATSVSFVDAAKSSGERATYTAISSCRLSDTRPNQRIGVRKSALGPKAQVTYKVTGNNGECRGIPRDAVAVALNVTALGATLPTHLTFWPSGAVPNASSLNPNPGQPPTPNAVTVDLASDDTFKVFNFQGNVDLIIDVVGFYQDHNHDDRYYTKGQANDRYYTKAQVDNRIANAGGGGGGTVDAYTKAQSDNRYYTKGQVDNRLDQKANQDTVSNQQAAINNLQTNKANKSQTYTRSQTYTKSEVNGLVDPKASTAYVNGEVADLQAQIDDLSTVTRTLLGTDATVTGAKGVGTVGGACAGVLAMNNNVLVLGIDVPVGATVSGVDVHVFDAPGAVSYTVDLYRNTTTASGFDSQTIATQVASGAEDGGGVTHALTPTVPETIDAGEVLSVRWAEGNSPSNSAENGLCAVTVTYSLP